MSEEKDEVKRAKVIVGFVESAYKKLEQENKDLESRLKEAEKFRDIFQKNDAENSLRIVSLEQRLSQAEAKYEAREQEHNGMLEVDGEMINRYIDKNKELEARLSHLIDVAGKMAGALKDCIEREFDVPMGGYNYGCGCSEYRGEFKHTCEAKLALAECDGIKDGGK